jgi:hypothetical protein
MPIPEVIALREGVPFGYSYSCPCAELSDMNVYRGHEGKAPIILSQNLNN